VRQHARNAAAEPVIAALMAGTTISEEQARDWLTGVLRAERQGFGSRILRRLPETRYYHGPQTGGSDDLLSEARVRKLILDEIR
jgi:hypothetical protein